MADTPELTRLHRLTDDEAELIQDYRLLDAETKRINKLFMKYQSEKHVEQTGGNVVGIRRAAE